MAVAADTTSSDDSATSGKPLPRAKDITRRLDLFDLMVIEPIERVTTLLRRGEPFTVEQVDRMERLRMRLEALIAALDARLSLVEDDK